MTYGFIDMELICMNMSDPFGADASDLPVIGQTQDLFEEVYLMIMRTDGYDAAVRLKDRIKATAPARSSPSEKDSLLSGLLG